MNWAKATDVILISSFAVLAVFVVLAIVQWVQRKSIKKVDRSLRWMPLPLAIMTAVYFIFDKLLILNTRPDGSGEPSFPSTHVMVVSTIFLITAFALPKYIKSKPALITIYILMLILVTLVCAGRVLANKHWLSDVIGGFSFAVIFALIYYAVATRRRKYD